MKKMLYITHLSGKRINRLWMSALQAGNALGYEVHLACNMDEIDPIGWQEDCKKYSVICHHIDFDRNPLALKNIKAYRQLKLFLKENPMDFIHCNTPVGGVLGRICAKQVADIPVIYQAHGFHFWKGAPLKNWLFYYPVEKYLSRYNDVLITINKEDLMYARKFVKEKAVLVHGVGVDLTEFSKKSTDKLMSIREKLGIPKDAFVMLSVGELTPRKNHIVALRAFAKANIPNSVYLICGVGELKKMLMSEAQKLGVLNQVKLLGFRRDVREILWESDCFCFPSHQEGLPVALMEAMAAGVPCIASKIRGNIDLLPESKYLFGANDEGMLTRLIQDVYQGKYNKEEVQRNFKTMKQYSIDMVIMEMKRIYEQIV